MEFLSLVNHIFPEFYAKKVLNGSKIDFQGIKNVFFNFMQKRLLMAQKLIFRV